MLCRTKIDAVTVSREQHLSLKSEAFARKNLFALATYLLWVLRAVSMLAPRWMLNAAAGQNPAILHTFVLQNQSDFERERGLQRRWTCTV